jgi:hypothetical protein
MAQVFKSGAFIQQCFASHPLCLTFKKFATPDIIILQCSSCRFRHDVRLRDMTSRRSASVKPPAQQQPAEGPAKHHLSRCAAEHSTALRVSGMDVTEAAMDVRCGECRRVYTVVADSFETLVP